MGIHAHNDASCAVANSLVAVEHGADMVQGTINGYGERCGNADLCAIIPALQLKMSFDCISDRNLTKLTDTSRFVAELCNVSPDPHQPYVGQNAFAHKGGMHVAGACRDPRTFEHVDPNLVGNTTANPDVGALGQGGRDRRAREIGLPLEDDGVGPSACSQG